MDKVKKDPRFAHIAKDPKFRRMKVSQRKVQIDKRFEGMFSDKSFKLKYSVDKRGKPMKKSTNEDLRRYYALEEDDEEEEKKKKKEKEKDKVKDKVKEDSKKKSETVSEDDRFKADFSSDDEEEEEESDEEEEEGEEEEKEEEKKAEEEESGEGSEEEKVENEEDKEEDEEDSEEDEEEDEDDEEEPGSGTLSGKMPDIARGEGLDSSSSEDEDDEDEDELGEDDDHKWGELDQDAPEVQEATCRLAVCNMDWDRIKAHDLFMLFNSFKPANGFIKSVHIYPSEYGMERMKEEQRLGPQELRKDAPAPATSQDDKPLDKRSDDAKEEREKMRKYQLNRLKYYYAVVECDTPETANCVYEECDGQEYESSAIRLDLRFIPEDMTFDQEPKSVATGVVDAGAYKPNLFVNTALQQAKVDCTWDETDRDRLAVTMKKYTKDELENLDMKDYLASSSDEEAEDIYAGFLEQPDFGKVEENEEKRLESYKELMITIKEKDNKKEEKDTEMEISWEPGLKETTEDIIKKKKKKETETVWEQYLDKKKEKKKEKLMKSKGKMENNNSVKTKDEESEEEEEEENEGMSDDDIPSDVDMNDPYFREEMENAEGETKTEKGKLKKKKKKKKPEILTPEEEAQKKKEEAELAMLMDDEDDDKEHFSLKSIMDAEKLTGKKKKKRTKRQMAKLAMNAAKKNVQDSFKMNLEDNRFNAVFETADYNIDPSAPEFKATKNMESLIQEKLKRKSKKQERMEKEGKGAKRQKLETKSEKDNSLAKLVSSVKMKTKSHQIKKKKS